MLNELMKDVHDNAVNHGWWKENRSFGEIIALCHSELSEALEEYRNGNTTRDIYYTCKGKDYQIDPSVCIKSDCETCELSDKKPEGIPIELADVIIRILDYCGKEGIDIDEAIKIKHEYNKLREYKHGGKKI